MDLKKLGTFGGAFCAILLAVIYGIRGFVVGRYWYASNHRIRMSTSLYANKMIKHLCEGEAIVWILLALCLIAVFLGSKSILHLGAGLFAGTAGAALLIWDRPYWFCFDRIIDLSQYLKHIPTWEYVFFCAVLLCIGCLALKCLTDRNIAGVLLGFVGGICASLLPPVFTYYSASASQTYASLLFVIMLGFLGAAVGMFLNAVVIVLSTREA